MVKFFKIIFFTLVLLNISKTSNAEFKKEMELTDQGLCEEALLENEKTQIEESKKFSSKKLFVGKYTSEIFKAYAIGRRVGILKNNCKNPKKALELGLEYIKLQEQNLKIPFEEVKSLNMTEFQRHKFVADAYATVSHIYEELNDLPVAIKYLKKSVDIYETLDPYEKENLLDYNYSILASYYNRAEEMKSANLYRKKHIAYMKKRYGEGTEKYYDAMVRAYSQSMSQGYYDSALNIILEVDHEVKKNEDFFKDKPVNNLFHLHDLASAHYHNSNIIKAISLADLGLKKIIDFKDKKILDEKTLLRWKILFLNDSGAYSMEIYDNTGDQLHVQRAEKLYLEVIKLSEESNQQKLKRDLFITKNNLVGVYRAQNQFNKARSLQEETYTTCVKTFGEKNIECLKQMVSLAVITTSFDLEKSRQLLEKFLVLEPKTNLAFLRTRVSARQSLGNVYGEMGNFKKAEQLALEAVNLIDPADSRFRKSYVYAMNDYYHNMIKLGKYKDSINGYKELIELVDKNYGKKAYVKTNLLNNLGFGYGLSGNDEKALEYYLKAEKLSKEVSNYSILAVAQVNLSQQYWARKDFKKSANYALLALGSNRLSPIKKAITYAGLMRALLSSGNFQDALKYGAEGKKFIDKNFGSMSPQSLYLLENLAFANLKTKNHEAYYQNLIDIYNISNDVSKGHKEFFNIRKNEHFQMINSFLWSASERKGKSDLRFKNYFNKVSIDSMENAIFNMTEIMRTTKVSVDTNKMIARNLFKDKGKIKKLKVLDRKIEEFGKLPRYVKNQEEKKKLAIKITRYKEEIETLKKDLSLADYVKGDSFTFNDISVEQVKKSLKDNEVILFYLTYHNNLYLGYLSNDNYRIIYTNQNGEVVKLIKKLRQSLKYENNSLSNFDLNISNQLYEKLISPFKNQLKTKDRLIIIPHGPLLSVPFEIFTDPWGKAKNLSEANWLIKDFDISYYPSISSYYLMQESKKKEFNSYFAGFGDPKLSSQDKKITASEVDISDLFLRGGIADVKKVKQLGELPKTGDEIKKISGFFYQKDIFLGDKFNEKIIKKNDLSKYSVISFATHGIIANEIQGLKEPGLIATPPQKGTLDNDGVLTASEIKKLNFDSELIILSACNTAAPDGTSSAEGLSGIASSFFYAGARSLLVSHWYVEDESTVNLMTGMFDNLSSTKNITSALRETKLKMIQDKKTEHPIFWAPFVLIGGST